MAIDPTQQIIQSLERASRVLVVPHKDFEPDAFASAIALNSLLKKLGKESDIYFTYDIPDKFSHLVKPQTLESPAHLSRDFIIKVSTNERQLKELRYKKENDHIKIYLTPESEPIRPSDISHEDTGDDYDLVVMIGCQDLESAGELFERYPHLFFNRPVINIDRSPHNEEFAEINLIDVTSAAIAETVTDLMGKWRHELVDDELATMLLTGLIAGTNNFRSHSTTPHTLSRAAELIALGGDHQKIIQNIYKTKPLSILKLLGRLMNKTEYLEDVELAWSELTSEDLRETESSAKDLALILDEFKEQFPRPEIIAIALTNGTRDYTKILFSSSKNHILKHIQREFGGEIRLNKIIIEAKDTPIDYIKEKVANLLRSF